MIIDASAIIAILRDEAEALSFAEAIAAASSRRVSAVSYVEAAALIDGSRDPIASRRFDDLFREAELVVEAVTEAQARMAREAYRDFGKGSGHPAGLNFGDCFAYALAKIKGEPILFKGDDFSRTDLTSALA
jgi:ribonuclease VapC